MAAPKKKDASTLPLPGIALPRGRPATGKARSGAARMKEYRQNQKRQVAYLVAEIGQAIERGLANRKKSSPRAV